jgi:pimeloyl-ACP methyl ester carboxylesterase
VEYCRYALISAVICSIAPPARSDERFVTEDVAFTAACDGTTQRYVRMLAKGFGSEAKHHLLVALHGHGSDRWQFASGTTSTGVAARNAAAERGMILVLPDYRAKTSWMGPKAEADVCQIIADLKEQYPVDKVFICGGSMGGSSALTFAALHPDLIDGVASMNGTANHLEYENFQDAITLSYGGTKIEIPQEYKKRSAEYWPERFVMPVAITASGKDTVVPSHSVLRLAEILDQIRRPVLTIYQPGMGHTSKPEDAQRALNFVLDQALRPADTATKTVPETTTEVTP